MMTSSWYKWNVALAELRLAALVSANCALAMAAPPVVSAAEAAGPVEQVIVTASRRAQPINEVSRTVMVLEQEVITAELAKSSNIANVLGTLVPGFGAPNHIDQLRTQTLRGREPLYLIDGVPLAFNGGAAFLQGPLVKFDSGTVERVEVLYGPTAIYGAGGTGGIIQFFSKRAPRDEAIEWTFRQSLTTYTGADDWLDDDALSWRSEIGAAGTLDRFDYVLSYSYDSQNGVFDGNGDIANPVYYGYTDDSSYFAKLGFEPDENQRFEVTYSLVEREFDFTDFDQEITDEGFAIAVESAEDNSFRYFGESEPKDDKDFFSFSYSHADVLGGELRLQAYHREDDIREPLSLLPVPPGFAIPDNYQAVKNDQSDGLRLQYSRSFQDTYNLVVGADYEEQDRKANAFVYDIGPLDDRSRDVTEPVREGLFIYPFTLDTLGLFAQLEVVVTDDLRFSAGVRHEDAEFEIGPGLRLFDLAQVNRSGGSGEDDGFAYNIGVTYDVSSALTVYANYAEGFEIPSLSQVSNLVPPDQPLESDEAIEPQIVDNYEVGLRGAADAFSYGFAAYYSESDFGQNFLYDPQTGLGEYNRSPERNYGFELVGGWQASEALLLGMTFSWIEAEFDPDDTGDFVAQSGLDVQPWKGTINADYAMSEDLSFQLTLLVVGDRDDALEDEVDLWEVEGYEVVDVGLDYQFDAWEAEGRLSLQVTNLFDETYLTPSSQSYTNNIAFAPRVAGAPGRGLSLNVLFTL